MRKCVIVTLIGPETKPCLPAAIGLGGLKKSLVNTGEAKELAVFLLPNLITIDRIM